MIQQCDIQQISTQLFTYEQPRNYFFILDNNLFCNIHFRVKRSIGKRLTRGRGLVGLEPQKHSGKDLRKTVFLVKCR